MVQVHVPRGVGVRVPPWAPKATEQYRRKTPPSLQKDCGVLRFCAPCSALARPHPFQTLDLPRHRVMLGLLMKTFSSLNAALLLACCCGYAAAEPAAWYQWRSKVDGQLVCSQTPLGSGWEKASGPYQDSHCQMKTRTK